MFFQHIYDKSLAQGSYFVGCQATGEAIVIDAKRDIDTYLEIAAANKLRITHITETHIHADFLSGSRELAAVTGATLYLSDEGGADWQYEFPHVGLRDGDLITVGNLSLRVMHTPGHTPESISFLLTDHRRRMEALFEPGREIVCYREPGEIPDLVRHYLHSDAERARITAAARTRILAEHTYDLRLKSLVRTMRSIYG